MKLSKAWLCLDCGEITEQSNTCHACSSKSLISLSKWIEYLKRKAGCDFRKSASFENQWGLDG